ncbi:pentatricopeptide repeat-containing protein At4g26680, mitochondrial isoform X3 [Rhodamnia argentea]|uniref:Pentatricopeptide repeat-containing protein At4g26680, mitochondrial isoform X2 n=1 Tax=Rhodamnia argentea TaxID=178133 RepID=A0ABM3HFS5_9MYRT|nr:pentatricopeptide repeat-containing protein At4g26680, mitochondrial isoform X2 [Rhodamnia argentea]XP_048135468.1 pentatricopeptide repeat-containing protein At4g26680, mitochondrial isoform X3 [Rhodamnia argentea]
MKSPFRRFSTLFSSSPEKPLPINPSPRRDPIPVPHRTIPEPRGRDLDFVNVAHSHLLHSDWGKLDLLSSGLTPLRTSHILLKIQKDHVLSLEFFNWVKLRSPSAHTLETHSIALHILTKNRKFKSAESIVRGLVAASGPVDLARQLFDAVLYSYRACDSSPRVFDSLFKTFAHLKKFRSATETFCMMKEYGFLPTVESCNAYLSALLSMNRVDVVFSFHREMRRRRIVPNVFTLNMVLSAFCKAGELEKAVDLFREMESKGCCPTVASYNTLITGHCSKGLLSSAMELKERMQKNGIHPSVITFNALISGFCKEGKLQGANKIFSDMKASNVAPDTVTYNTLIHGYSEAGDSEMGGRLFEEMPKYGVRADILTYNALILGLCKNGKTKKAAYLVKDLDGKGLVPNNSTFSALIRGQCIRNNPDGAFQLYKTLTMLMCAFAKCDDLDGAVQVLAEMVNRSMLPDSDMLSEVCHELHHCGKDQVAMKLCSELQARTLIPVGFDKGL